MSGSLLPNIPIWSAAPQSIAKIVKTLTRNFMKEMCGNFTIPDDKAAYHQSHVLLSMGGDPSDYTT